MAAPLAVSTWVARVRAALGRSVWMPVGLRITGIAALMLGLAAVGASSVVNATRGAERAGADPGGFLPGLNARALISPTGARSGNPAAPPAVSAQTDAAAGTLPSAGMTADGRVILNRASRDELTRLPGVGVKRADAIVRLRDRLKRFRRVTDLLRVRGIGPKTLRRMRPHLVLDTPEPETPTRPAPSAE